MIESRIKKIIRGPAYFPYKFYENNMFSLPTGIFLEVPEKQDFIRARYLTKPTYYHKKLPLPNERDTYLIEIDGSASLIVQFLEFL